VDLLYNKLHNKSTTNRSNGVCALLRIQSHLRRFAALPYEMSVGNIEGTAAA